MRIIAGTYRARALKTPTDATIRPTSDKTRGSIFNILEHQAWPVHPLLPTSHVADVCCGTGAMGLEALSRGVAHATFIDASPASIALARANIAALTCTDKATLMHAKADQIGLSGPRFDLVMLDPPYHQGLGERILRHFEAQHLFKPGCVITVETAKNEPLALSSSFEKRDERSYGKALVRFYVFRPPS